MHRRDPQRDQGFGPRSRPARQTPRRQAKPNGRRLPRLGTEAGQGRGRPPSPTTRGNAMSTTAPAVIDQRPLAPLDLTATKQSMDTYQQGLHSLLDATDWQKFGSGEKERAFVKRSGWRKIATWFNLNLENRRIEVERDEHGNPIRASVIARATAPNGRYAEGEGAASLTERRFSKPEHDLPATAATRALNRAI